MSKEIEVNKSIHELLQELAGPKRDEMNVEIKDIEGFRKDFEAESAALLDKLYGPVPKWTNPQTTHESIRFVSPFVEGQYVAVSLTNGNTIRGRISSETHDGLTLITRELEYDEERREVREMPERPVYLFKAHIASVAWVEEPGRDREPELSEEQPTPWMREYAEYIKGVPWLNEKGDPILVNVGAPTPVSDDSLYEDYRQVKLQSGWAPLTFAKWLRAGRPTGNEKGGEKQ